MQIAAAALTGAAPCLCWPGAGLVLHRFLKDSDLHADLRPECTSLLAFWCAVSAAFVCRAVPGECLKRDLLGPVPLDWLYQRDFGYSFAHATPHAFCAL
jgi:hypothetical protein